MPYSVEGTINEHQMPVCRCCIINSATQKFVEVSAIIDTGAYDFFLKKSLIELLELEQVGNADSLHPVDGIITSAVYKADLAVGTWRFDTTQFKILHSETYPVSVIIGSVFLTGKTFKYDGIQKTWILEW